MGKILGPQNNSLESAVFKEGKFPWLKEGDTWSNDSRDFPKHTVSHTCAGGETIRHLSIAHELNNRKWDGTGERDYIHVMDVA